MSKPMTVTCINCGRTISGVNNAKSDGWIFQDDGNIFCCCACISEYKNKNKKSTTKKKKSV